jgi:hypothetical protein
LQQQRADVRLVGTTAGDGNEISDRELGRHKRLPIDEAHDRPQEKIDEDDESSGHDSVEGKACARQYADCRGTPERRGGVETTNAETFAKDQPGAQETDAGDDLWRNLIQLRTLLPATLASATGHFLTHAVQYYAGRDSSQ